jgi:hypothetical protein
MIGFKIDINFSKAKNKYLRINPEDFRKLMMRNLKTNKSFVSKPEN